MGLEREQPGRLQTAAGVTLLGGVVNVLLSAAKLAVGVICHSQSIFVDGLHSLSDLATDLAVLAGIRISRRPADSDHHYGHRRAMTLVTALLGLALLGAAGVVGYRAVMSFRQTPAPLQPMLPLIAAGVSIVLKELLYHITVRVGRRTQDTSVVANAWHHRSDAFSSIAAAAGLSAAAVGGAKWHFADHLAAFVLASFLVVVAWRIFRGAAGELMDRAPSRRVMGQIQQAVADTSGVRSFHAFRARQLGGKVEMDVHVQVDPELTVRQGHDIASTVRARVTESCPEVQTVIVHIEPPQKNTNFPASSQGVGTTQDRRQS